MGFAKKTWAENELQGRQTNSICFFGNHAFLSGGHLYLEFLGGRGKACVKFTSGPNGKCGTGGKTFAGNVENLMGAIWAHVLPSRAGMGSKAIGTRTKLPK